VAQQSPPSVSPAASARGSAPSLGRRRLVGEELIADLFEAMHDLHFLRDPFEGADFVLSLVMDKLPSQVGLVHFYDIDAREFVVVRALGPGAATRLGHRTSEKDPVVAEAMRKRRAVVVADVEAGEQTGRWEGLEVPARSFVCAPVELAGRFLGLLELCNPRDETAFGEGDGHALTYIGEQFAEFLGARTIVLGRAKASN
jgi:GAF domain-containing protein